VENKAEFACSQVATAERFLHKALASVDCNILCPVRVSLRKRAGILPVSSMTSSLLSCFFHALLPQLQSQDSADVTALQAEVTRVQGPWPLLRPIVSWPCLPLRLLLGK
jgi:hypothetical protein